ncbi:DMT family transporter [Sulfitobacter sp. HNIBRBA3233]|uniref:DMT family transporter n=1 Tax=Sulfitobacter marinivivus TaxID=3158558 RepID=UPI0032E05042
MTLPSAQLGILCMICAMFAISLNDMLIKALSGGYPLHQIVFVRTAIGLVFTLALLRWEGGWHLLKTRAPGLHLLRATLLVGANTIFYAAFVTMPLATANALYFVAPLLVSLLSVPILGERIGLRRILAILAGFVGVLVMLAPQMRGADAIGWLALLPVIAASCYALMAVLTRMLGREARASALAFYAQAAFLVVSLAVFAVAGQGQFLKEGANDSLVFLLRPWVWPAEGDWAPFIGLGLTSAVVGYTISQAYRLANAATVAPFEYILLLFALFWGWTVFGEWPQPLVFVGAAIIVAAGIYVFLRERRGGYPRLSSTIRRIWSSGR